MLVNNDNWMVSIQSELSSMGLKYLFDETRSNQCKTYKIIECRILDIYKQSLMSSFSTSPKSMLYQHLVDNFCLQTYLRRPINYTSKKFISIFRTSSHSLVIEKGRHNKVPKNERFCNLCNKKI